MTNQVDCGYTSCNVMCCYLSSRREVVDYFVKALRVNKIWVPSVSENFGQGFMEEVCFDLVYYFANASIRVLGIGADIGKYSALVVESLDGVAQRLLSVVEQ